MTRSASSATWIALGDSFTTGVGDDPTHGGWVARTADALVRDGLLHGLRNLAVPGVRVDAVHTDQLPALTGRHEVVSAIAGANDVLAFGLDVPRLLDRLDRLVQRARDHGRVVLISTCPDFFAHRFGPGTRLSWRVDELNEAVWLAAASAKGQVVVLDTHAVLRDATLWDPDGVHPNPTGHELLAAAALPLLRPLLRPVTATPTPS